MSFSLQKTAFVPFDRSGFVGSVDKSGAEGQNRTADTRIFSPVFCNGP
jgi:hypothetical protein